MHYGALFLARSLYSSLSFRARKMRPPYICDLLLNFVKYFLVSASIQFTYVENYPDEAPIIEVKSLEAMTDSQIDDLQKFLNEKVKKVFICSIELCRIVG